MRYSPSQNGFYPEDTHYPNLPDDIIEIPNDLYAQLLDGQSNGKIITPNGGDAPYLSDPAPPTPEQIIAQAEADKKRLKLTADGEIEWRQDAVDAEIATEEEITELAAWKKYRVLLMRVDLAKPEWPPVPES